MIPRNIRFYPTHPVMDDMINDFFSSAFGNTKTVSKYPLTNIYIKDGLAYFDIAVAGFEKRNISIELTDDVLHIKGVKPTEATDENIKYIKKDIAERNFAVSYSLMFPVESIEAEIVDGILKVIITPAVEQTETKKIEIK